MSDVKPLKKKAGVNTQMETGDTVPVANGGTGLTAFTQYLLFYADTTGSISQIPIGTAGQVLRSFGAGVAPSFSTLVSGGYKAANQSVTSSTTLVDCTGLSFAIDANATMNFILDFASTANSSGGMKWAFTIPSGATGKVTGQGNNTTATDSVSVTTGFGATFGVAATQKSRLFGTIVNSTNAGTVQFQFAQNASFGTSTIVLADATITAYRVA